MKKKHTFLLILLAIFLITRLLFLNSGLNLLEPDESDYQFVADGFSKGWPTLRGELYIEQFPLFHFLAYLLNFLKSFGPYAPVRLLSIIGAFLVGISLYLWAREKLSEKIGLWTMVVFWLIPLSSFYSRNGTLDMLMLGFLSMSFYFFEKKSSRQRISGILAGIFFSLAFLTKNTALIFLIYYCLSSFFNKQKVKRFLWFLVSTTTSVLLAYGPYWYFFKNTTTTTKEMVSKHFLPLANIKVHLATLWIYITKAGFYISWPVVLLSILGIFGLLKNFKKTSGAFWSLIPWLIFVFLFDHSPRYFLFLTPAIALLASFALSKIKPLFLKIIIILLILPANFIALKSTWHQGIEESTRQVLNLNNDTPIYSTFDPEKLERIVGKKVSLLNSQATQSGVVVIDKRKTELLLALRESQWKEAYETLNWIKKNKKPVWVYNDPYPHFPGTNKSNEFKIYIFNPKR